MGIYNISTCLGVDGLKLQDVNLVLWNECIFLFWSFYGLYTRIEATVKNPDKIHAETRYCTL